MHRRLQESVTKRIMVSDSRCTRLDCQLLLGQCLNIHARPRCCERVSLPANISTTVLLMCHSCNQCMKRIIQLDKIQCGASSLQMPRFRLQSGAHNESSVVRRQERDTPTHLIKIPNLHMMDVLLKIDWMMADAARTCY